MSARLSFRARLIAGALAPLVLAGLIQALYSVVSQRRVAVDGLEAKARAVTGLLVNVAGPNIATDDPQGIDDGLGYFANDPDFSFALAIAPDGKSLGYRGAAIEKAAHVAAARITRQPELRHAGGTLLASYPVITGTKTIGEIVVGFKTENVDAEAAMLTARAGLFSLAGMIAAVLVVLALASRIARRNREMTALLDNIDQGFLSIGPDGTLTSERSAMATRLLGDYQPGQKLWDAVAAVDAKAAAWMKLGWDSIRDGFLPIELSFEQLPNKLVAGDRVYRVEYKPSFDGEAVADTLVVITDATADIARARAEAAEHDLLRTIEKLTKDRVGFLEFVDETDRLAREIAASVDQPISVELKRAVHTLKGNCGLFGQASLAEACHELETRLEEETTLYGADAHPITSAWAALKAKLESVFGPELMAAGVEVRAEDIAELQEALARGAPLGTIRQLVKSWSLERVKPRLERFADQARELAKRLGKGDVEVVIADHGVRLESSEGRRFWAAFTHVVRNAVDHGIEPESERVSRGKPACGRIEIETRHDGSAVVVELRDDGRGIDWESVRSKAIDAGLPAGSHEQLVDAILSDGLTTRDAVTETSGRGVGLAALQAACADAGGVIDVNSEPGRGARFTFRFPRWAEDLPIARSIA